MITQESSYSAEQFEKVLSQHNMVAVDFFATWCGPCKMFAPTFEKLSSDFNGKLEFLKIDIDKNEDIADHYNVKSVPTFILFKDGKEIDRKVGVPAPKEYVELINSNL